MVFESKTSAVMMVSVIEGADAMRDNGDAAPLGRRRKKRRAADAKVKKFGDIYVSTGEVLGEGSFGQVITHRNVNTGKEFAVKIVEKKSGQHGRLKMLKEIETFHHCQGHENILQLIEYFEEDNLFYVVFEKMEGGTLLDSIRQRGHLTEEEASKVVRDIASGLSFLHNKGIAHRDLKPENILCVSAGKLTPVKICDFDLGSGVPLDTKHSHGVTTPELLSPVGSADFMAPEVVDVWLDRAWSYDKRCDLWSLGIILYILLCGYRPFYASCGKDCGFSEGQPCEDCQELLFKCIQDGVYSFPQKEWSTISDEALDLVQCLLVRDPHQRYTADEVLAHPWIHMQESLPNSQLSTPYLLSRTNSVRELGLFAENANAMNRLIQQHLSFTEARTFVAFDPANDDCCPSVVAEDDDGDCAFLERAVFQLGMSDDEMEDRTLGMWSEDELEPWVRMDGCKQIQLPGASKLARRRQAMRHRCSIDSDDSGSLTSCSPPTHDFSPVS